METDNPQLISFLQEIRPKITIEFQPKIDDLIIYYQKKLWHQLTMTCEAFYRPNAIAVLPKPVLISLFQEFIAKWSKKMNQLSFTTLAVKVSELLGNNEAIELLEGLAEIIKKENLTENIQVSFILARIEVAQYYLKDVSSPENVIKARDYIDECIELVETMPISPPVSVQASVYRISAFYDKISLNYSAFYRHTILYLACDKEESTETEAIKPAMKQELAHDLCIAALLSDEIFNFGELLENEILKNLIGTNFEFLVNLISSFNSGDLTCLRNQESKITNHPALMAHLPFLQEKLCLMSLAQFLFLQIKNDRRVHFSKISNETKVPIDQVEFLLIRAISCKIIKGIIDQVDSSISVTWIQPRLLDQSQINDLNTAITTWNRKVSHTLEIVQDMRDKGAFTVATTTII